VKLPGKNRFVPLETLGQQVPIGSTFDATKGTVQLSLAANSRGATQEGAFSMGQFTIHQTRKNPLTTVSIAGGRLNAC
jgi:hypothetical protein